MKRILFTAFLAALTLGLTSCPGEKTIDPSSADLIGTWDLTQTYYIYKENGEVVDEDTETLPRDYRIAVTFNADGTSISEHYDEGELDSSFYATWTLSGNTLTITEDGDSMKHTVEKLDSRTLVLSFSYHEVEDGVTYDDFERMIFTKTNRR